MRHFYLLIRALLCLACVTGLVSAQSVAILTGKTGTGTTIPILDATTVTVGTTVQSVPPGAFALLAKPDGTKYYVISNVGSGGVSVMGVGFSNLHSIGGSLAVAPSVAALTPDGKKLLVVAGRLFIFDTITDTLLNPAGQSFTGTINDIAFSVDSTIVYVLSSSNGLGYVTKFDLVNSTSGLSVPLPASGSTITTAPNGLLYVTTPNRLFEMDPRTLDFTVNGQMAINGLPGRPVFTPDGQYALAINNTPVTGASVHLYNLTNHTITSYPNTGVALKQLVLANDNRVFAIGENGSLYEVTITGGLNITRGALQNVVPTDNTNGIVISNENPARNLYLVSTAGANTNIYRVDLTNNTVGAQTAVANAAGQVLNYISPNPTSGGIALVGYNNNQVLAKSATALPLVVRVVDSLGRGVFGARVDFAKNPAAAVLSAPSAFTNSEGYAQTYLTAPADPGEIKVTATSPGVPGELVFTATVPGGSTGCTVNCTVASITKVGGDGQLVPQGERAAELLTVLVTDVNGNPAVGQTVTFNLAGTGSIGCPSIGDDFPNAPVILLQYCTGDTVGSMSVPTDVDGRVGIKFIAAPFLTTFNQSKITASAASGSVVFTVTSYIPTGPPQVILLAPELGSNNMRTISGGAGETINGALQVRVISLDAILLNTPIPNVAVNVTATGDPATTPSGVCAGGPVLTNEQGVAVCNLTLGPVLSQGAPTGLRVVVGGKFETALVTVFVTVGPPAKISILQGNQQTGRPGQQFTLRARVTDTGNNATANRPVTWAVTSGSATLSGVAQNTDSQGIAQATLTLGNTAGPVVVKLTAGTGTGAPTVNFNLTNSIPVASLTAISGGGQTANVGQSFQNPLVVEVRDSSGGLVSGVTVNFTIQSGSAAVTTNAVTTDAQGRAATTITAGSTPGTITIVASSGTSSTTFTLTSRLPGPGVNASSFTNAPSGAIGITPCGVQILRGNGIATGIQGTVQASPFIGILPTTFTSGSYSAMISVNGVLSPIFWVSNTTSAGEQIAFQTPCETAPGTANVTVTINGSSTTVTGVNVQKFQPGIFDAFYNNQRYALVLHADPAFPALNGAPVTPELPARQGEILKTFATGLGQVTPATGTNRAGTGGQLVNAPLIIGVNNAGVRLISAEYLQGSVGIYVVTFQIPAAGQDGSQVGQRQPLVIAVTEPGSNAVYSQTLSIPISQ